MIQDIRFDVKKFASDMESVLGGKFISILASASHTSVQGASRWFKPDVATKNGPSGDKRKLIGDFLSKNYGFQINWPDYFLGDEIISNDETEKMKKKIALLESRLSEEIAKNIELKMLLDEHGISCNNQ